MARRNHVHLPEDIIIEIFLRLPFDSILECKRVSKLWKKLINDTKFCIIYHLNRSISLFVYENELYCAMERPKREVFPGFHLWMPHRIPPHSVHRIPIGSNVSFDNNRSVLLSGWSDGIACVKGKTGNFLLYNVFTGASLIVSDGPPQRGLDWIFYGFGYDAYADDYNIIVVCSYETEQIMGDNSQFWVYSLRNRGWKSFTGFPCAADTYDWGKSSCYFNGVLYWVAFKNLIPLIVTYDLHTCRFGQTSAPNAKWIQSASLTELDRRLCFVCEYKYKNDIDVWAMNEHGVESCWTKLFAIHEPHDEFPLVATLAHTTLYHVKSGVVLFVFNREDGVFWYEFRKKKMIRVGIPQSKGRLLVTRIDRRTHEASPPRSRIRQNTPGVNRAGAFGYY